MKLFKKTTLFLFALLFILSSATIVPKHTEPKFRDVTSVLNAAKADGKVSKKELKTIIETAKGSSLTLKEKIAISNFGKKLGNKIIAESKAQGSESGGKSQIVALLLCLIVGGIGIHRFYLGYTWQGVVQILTLGGLGIWTLIDLIRIITGDLKPKNGDYDKTL